MPRVNVKTVEKNCNCRDATYCPLNGNCKIEGDYTSTVENKKFIKRYILVI